MHVIEAVPRAEAESMFPHLKGKKLWGEQESYDVKECADIHYIVYGPLELKALAQAHRIFKSVKVVTKGEA